ncbi:MAG: L-dopachrome tautomerase-related protein [Acidobacteriota bacterium]
MKQRTPIRRPSRRRLSARRTSTLLILGLAAVLASPLLAQPTLEIVAELDQRPGNPAIGPGGEIFLSMHPFDAPEFKVVRLEKDGSLKPFPNPKISSGFVNVIGIVTSQDGILWMLDMGSAEQSPKLLGWSPRKNRLEAVHYLPIEVVGENPFFQDLAVDSTGRRAYLADMSRGDLVGLSRPAIVVVNLDSGEARRVLEGHEFFQPPPGAVQKADGQPMRLHSEGGAQPITLGLNPIALDGTASYLYFSTITPGPVRRVPTRLIGSFSRTDSQIAQGIRTVGEKKSSDGFTVSGEQVILTNIDDSSIDVLENGELRTLIQDPRLNWPDGVAVERDGSLIVTVNQLHRAPPFNPDNRPGGKPPYLVVRISGQ